MSQIAHIPYERHADPSQLVHFGIRLDDTDSPADAIDALALAAFVSGEEPWSVTKHLARVRKDAPLLPPDVAPLRVATYGKERTHLAGGDGWTLHAVRWNDRSAKVTVTAVREELARSVLIAAIRDAAEPLPPVEEATRMGFWYSSRDGAGARCAPSASRRGARSGATTRPWPPGRSASSCGSRLPTSPAG